MKAKIKFIVAVMAVTFTAASCNVDTKQQDTYIDGTATLAGQTINIEVANTDAKRERGLSGRSNIEDNQGMLFTFDKQGRPDFWMKDMLMPIDIVWIKDQRIVDISKSVPIQPNVKSDSEYVLYNSKLPVNQVLELKSGWSERFGLKIGDQISLKIQP